MNINSILASRLFSICICAFCLSFPVSIASKGNKTILVILKEINSGSTRSAITNLILSLADKYKFSFKTNKECFHNNQLIDSCKKHHTLLIQPEGSGKIIVKLFKQGESEPVTKAESDKNLINVLIYLIKGNIPPSKPKPTEACPKTKSRSWSDLAIASVVMALRPATYSIMEQKRYAKRKTRYNNPVIPSILFGNFYRTSNPYGALPSLYRYSEEKKEISRLKRSRNVHAGEAAIFIIFAIFSYFKSSPAATKENTIKHKGKGRGERSFHNINLELIPAYKAGYPSNKSKIHFQFKINARF